MSNICVSLPLCTCALISVVAYYDILDARGLMSMVRTACVTIEASGRRQISMEGGKFDAFGCEFNTSGCESRTGEASRHPHALCGAKGGGREPGSIQ